MRRRRPLLAVLAGLLAIAGPVRESAHAEDPKAAAPRVADGPDLDRAMDAVRYLFADPAWTVTTRTYAEAGLPVTVGLSPAERRKAPAGARVDGRSLTALVLGDRRRATLDLALYRSDAAAWADVVSKRDEVKEHQGERRGIAKAEFAEGAGAEGKLPGYATRSLYYRDGAVVSLVGQCVAIGPVVFELSLMDVAEIDRAAQDEAIVRLAAFLRDPKALAALPAPRAPAIGIATRPLAIVVADEQGRPVPRAKAHLRNGDDVVEVSVVSGRAETRLPNVALRVDVGTATDDGGVPLPLAPVSGLEIAADQERLEVRLLVGAAIDGQALDDDGSPLAGLSVPAIPGWDSDHLCDLDSTRLVVVHGRATTDGDGRFRVVGLAKGPYTLLLRDGDATVSARPVHATAGDGGVVLRRAPGHDPMIRVFDPKGRPLPDAAVDLSLRRGDEVTRVQRARTGPDGRVRLHPCRPGERYRLDVIPPPTREELADLRLDPWTRASDTVSLENGYTVRGVTVDGTGRHVQATVTLEPGGPGDVCRVVTSGEDGSFEFPGVPRGPAQLWAGAPHEQDGDAPDSWLRRREPVTPEDPFATVQYVPEFPVRIRILDDEGHPTRGATVLVEAPGLDAYHDLPADEWYTTVPEGTFSVHAFGARRGDGRALGPQTREGIPAGTPLVEMRLGPGLELTGRVVDDAGRAVAGAQLALRGVDANDDYRLMMRGFQAWGIDPEDVITTDDAGRFGIPGLGRQRYRLVVVPRDDHSRSLEPFVEGGAKDVVLTMHAAIATGITVVDPENKPVAGARVSVARSMELPVRFERVATVVATASTDASGVAHLPALEPGAEYELTVETPPSRDDLGSLWRDSWSLEDERVRLNPGYTLRGRVLDADGKPAPGVSVFVAVENGIPLARTRSQADGTFVVRGMTPGPRRVKAVPPGWGWRIGVDDSWSPLRPGTTDITLHLPPRPAGFKVHAEGGGGHEGYVASTGDWKPGSLHAFELDANGNAEIPSLTPGLLSFWVLPTEADDRTAYRADVSSDADVASVTLSKPRAIRVRLAMPDDARLAYLHVVGPMGARFPWTRTPDGLYEARGLPPGRWTVYAAASTAAGPLHATAKAEAGTFVALELR